MIIERNVILKNSKGLHARPAAIVVNKAKSFKSEVTISKDTDTVNAKSIMGVLMLAAPSGTSLSLRAEGDDAQLAIDELSKIIEGDMEY